METSTELGILHRDCIASFSFCTAISCCWQEALSALSAKSFCQLTAKTSACSFCYMPFLKLLKNEYFKCYCGFDIPNLRMYEAAVQKINWGWKFPSELIHSLSPNHMSNFRWMSILVGQSIIILGNVICEVIDATFFFVLQVARS